MQHPRLHRFRIAHRSTMAAAATLSAFVPLVLGLGLPLVLGLTLALGPKQAAAEPGGLDGLAPGWNAIPGPPGSGCSDGSPYRFYVHPGDAARLAIYFEGGGACWSAETCDPAGKPTFTPSIQPWHDPTNRHGILDLSNPENPFAGFTMVSVPYCTGDVFLGARDVTYTRPAPGPDSSRTFEIRHEGMADAQAVLAWIFERLPHPDLVFVAGSSGGAPCTPLYAAEIARHYPDARVVQFGDGAGGYRSAAISQVLEHWGAAEALGKLDRSYAAVDPATLSFESLYVVSAREEPRVRYAQYNNAEDAVQLDYLRMVGVQDTSLHELLAANLDEIRRANPEFRSYTAPGKYHTILERPEFYRLRVSGVPVRDWVAALLAGRAVEDVGDSLLIAGSGER